MSKYTPGPWNSSKFGFQVLTGDSWSTICELKGPAEWEDGRGSYEQEYEWQIQQANARLIAAAPDLLEAVIASRALVSEAAQTGFNYAEGDWADRLYANQAVLSAAISKAKGEDNVQR